MVEVGISYSVTCCFYIYVYKEYKWHPVCWITPKVSDFSVSVDLERIRMTGLVLNPTAPLWGPVHLPDWSSVEPEIPLVRSSAFYRSHRRVPVRSTISIKSHCMSVTWQLHYDCEEKPDILFLQEKPGFMFLPLCPNKNDIMHLCQSSGDQFILLDHKSTVNFHVILKTKYYWNPERNCKHTTKMRLNRVTRQSLRSSAIIYGFVYSINLTISIFYCRKL